jgi:TPP-dependent indolepyruvate ferredoxin oxidoreductase alpha subunit
MELEHVDLAKVKILEDYVKNQSELDPLSCVYLDETCILKKLMMARRPSVKRFKKVKVETKG